ncbi:glycoside hydrolase family 3 protein [Aaosphaeria arxii CBS 175.79]|uniref:beta-glucosidase n=1 Tax=Aaosphaeria arxii CBS 175.79 TaxID=1450172 RepID=A0A6A5XIS0_9PLEO|nr:glycoside hydrolase family 3 protein [Aaosphaeria arxii CBS 175.79]KAF2012731.1 glycoside hydrolase family 3 protein [Aaosphaeria arxii CBS 175.79]
MTAAMFSNAGIEDIISKLDLDEKVELLTGAGRCALQGNERLGIPVIHTSDGPHGLRGANFFNPVPGVQFPSATAMGATFDIDLLRKIGQTLGDEAIAKGKHIALAPTVCLQRSPLIGRGFEAFGEDPILSGILGGHYIAGIQDRRVAACIKHYAAHDQSANSIEDDVIMTERTLRELHLLPFQTAMKICPPWAFMTSYNKVNGVHASESPFLIQQVLRKEWRFDGLVMSDWWGTYSTSESMNAGMDLEMPGPTVWRGKALKYAVECRKVRIVRIDDAVRNVLNIVAKTHTTQVPKEDGNNDTPENRAIARKVASDSIVLLKNDNGVLPLSIDAKKKIGLIGDHFKTPATGGGGSSEATPYYVSTPYDAIVGLVGAELIETGIGAYSHRFTPLLTTELRQPNSGKPGLFVELFSVNPDETDSPEVLWSAETRRSLLQFTDSLPKHLPDQHFVRIRTTFTSPKTTKYRFGLSAFGKVVMRIDGRQVIDLWTNHPEKTETTPVFNAFSMERFYDVDVTQGESLEICIVLSNVFTGPVVGIAPAGGIRLGGCEVLDEDKSINDAVALAKSVDIPIVMTGISSDYEMESADRTHLALPNRVDELIERVVSANSNTIVIIQSGLPVTMPWVSKVNTLLHAWYGGQETGNGIADVLFGKVNPSGRLSVTFPKRLEDTPAFLNFGKTDREVVYGEGVFVGYRYYEKLRTQPLFYFGYGLSYTQFQYSNLVVPDIFEPQPEYKLPILVDVTNIGNCYGSEVIQVYVFDVKCSVQRPRKELKAFHKIGLKRGESRTARLELDRSTLAFWSEEDNKWKAEAGVFQVIISRSADPTAEELVASFELPRSMLWNGL